MAEQIKNNYRNCATCAHWTGPRQVTRRGYVEVPDGMRKALCAIHSADGRRYRAVYYCNKWLRWGGMR